jgi:hypothetical protein
MTLIVPDLSNGIWRATLPGGLIIGETPFLIDAPGPQIFGAPELRRSTRPRPGDHGVLYVGPDLYGSVKVVIPVVIFGASELDAMNLLQQLATACAPVAGGYAQLTWTGPRGDWVLTGRFDPVDAPSLALIDTGVVQAIVTFEASDPRYRSTTTHTLVLQAGVQPSDSGYGFSHGYPIGYQAGTGAPGTSGAVVNNGTAPASATITITAQTALVNPAVVITPTQDTLAFTTTLQPGMSLIVDTATGRALLSNSPTDLTNAINASNLLAFPDRADMLHFPAGSTPVAFTATSGVGSATIAWQDTYLF